MDKMQIGAHLLALGFAFALAMPIGWDREKRARSAGLRTFPLVAMASCGFVQASENLLVHSPDGMAKVIEGLITGIGFIGGGAISGRATPCKARRPPRAFGRPAPSASPWDWAATTWR
jgi:putative Mg2+ transporter-C (MgtC) family protein